MILEWDMWEISYEARKALNHCYDSSLRLIKLTNDILMLSKIESWKMEYYPSKFKILDFIKSVQNDVFVEAEEQKVELEIEIEKSLKNKSIYYDKDRLKQVFINLISNAIKFTPENKKVIVKASQREKNILFEIIEFEFQKTNYKKYLKNLLKLAVIYKNQINADFEFDWQLQKIF